MNHQPKITKGDSKRTRQANKRGDRKKESSDSPEIPDRGVGHQTSHDVFHSFLIFNARSTAKSYQGET